LQTECLVFRQKLPTGWLGVNEVSIQCCGNASAHSHFPRARKSTIRVE